ncbi:hypothetical protein [Marinobacter manganoxydans]|uniref:Uncharacterized protein n=1 Tax=Marinobacter manganoxydans MnI7-9 TaxID=1094979 RepID=G6YYL6_9GAMM|nr:hypothetical protein [Marinobacter manganoxydans]EHJ02819.1 hypothetical protein KYE_20954 [Marinobacter manganoxydans MnI7-9]
MKVMISAFIAALLIATAAPMVLNQFGWSSAAQTSSESVRLD